MANFTRWFEPGTKPARKGVYQVAEYGYQWTAYQHWNGKYWGELSFSPMQAFRSRASRSIYQDHLWRGLTYGESS